MVPIKVNLANKNNFGERRAKSSIEFIVIHYTANDGDSDESNGKYFANNIVNASAHYFVDDDSITQSVPDNYVAWSVGGNKYPNTNGGSSYRKCINKNSISIEMCDTKRNGEYDFTEETIKNTAELVKTLMKKYKIPISKVIRHYDVTGKVCPAPFVKNKKAWENFKERLVDEVVESSKIIVEGNEIPIKRILKDGSNFVSIRDLAEALGYKISNKGNIAVLSK